MRIYSFIEKKRAKRKRRKLLIFATILLAILIVFIFISMFRTTKIKTNLLTPKVETSLGKTIQDSLNGAEGVYAELPE